MKSTPGILKEFAEGKRREPSESSPQRENQPNAAKEKIGRPAPNAVRPIFCGGFDV
jgi:hypothetical protein